MLLRARASRRGRPGRAGTSAYGAASPQRATRLARAWSSASRRRTPAKRRHLVGHVVGRSPAEGRPVGIVAARRAVSRPRSVDGPPLASVADERAEGRIRRELDGARRLALARLVLATIRVCLRYRVTGLASEAAFFMLLSLPPLVLGLFGGLGYVGGWIGGDAVDQVDQLDPGRTPRGSSPRRASRKPLLPTVDDVLKGGRVRPHLARLPARRCGRGRGPSTSSSTPSRSCTGRTDVRGIVHTRALSFSLYAARARRRHRHASRSCCSGRASSAAGCPSGCDFLSDRSTGRW